MKHTKGYHYTHNKNTIKSLGFGHRDQKLCGYCGNEPTGGRSVKTYCCEKYNSRNRRNYPLILNMKIMKLDHRNRIVTAWPIPKCELDYDSDGSIEED